MSYRLISILYILGLFFFASSFSSAESSNSKAFEQFDRNLENIINNWSVDESVDPISKAKKISISKMSDEPTFERSGRKIFPTLVVRCVENKTEVYIDAKEFLKVRDIPVEVRVGESKPYKSNWRISSDYKALFSYSPLDLAKSFKKSANLVVRYTPQGENPRTVVFDLSKIKEPLGRVSSLCRWY